MGKMNGVGLLIVAGLIVVIALAACGSSPTQVPPMATDPAPPAPVSPAATDPAPQPALAPTAAPTPDGATLLETRCSVCHSTDRPKNSRLTKDQWNQLVDIMIAHGAQLTDAEKAVLVDYLAATYGP